MIYLRIRRIMDILLSIIGLIVLSPLFLILFALIKIDSKGPIFFTQTRVGKDKTHFIIYKFRTMSIDTPKNTPTHLLENPNHYITKMGKFLRRTSLDELPQIVNILRGDMAIVGPRPALWNQYDLIEQRDLHGANDVLPGLTGLAQISGRDELPIEEKAAIDGEYVKNISLMLDLKCFFKTIGVVVNRKGVVEGKSGESQEEKGIGVFGK